MRETPEELEELQTLLDASLSRSTPHLRSIVGGRTLTAEQLTRILTGMRTRPVHRDGEGRAADQRRGRAFPARQVALRHGARRRQARHLAARPAASVAHMRGEDLGVFTHGTVEILNPGTANPPRTGRTCSRTSRTSTATTPSTGTTTWSTTGCTRTG
nr:hypothetical protein GCM10020093_046730 [Planobispora longispora]